jgi:hypothetical protein
MKYVREERIAKLVREVSSLPDAQLGFVEPVVQELLAPYIEKYNFPKSDLIDKCVLDSLGDSIRIHHCFSKGPFTKDKFEFALEKVFSLCGRNAKLGPLGNPGYDIVIDGVKFSLKTEAEKAIKQDRIHISKAMELGKGEWDLDQLRQQFLNHLRQYERILILRCLTVFYPPYECYELVEIPKALLLESVNGELREMDKSRQNPKPGYCDVKENGNLKFQLYFDGGGERKLQIKNLLVSLCSIHARWKFRKLDSSETNYQLDLDLA